LNLNKTLENMKSLIIKLGKIFSLFRRVGFKTAIEIIYGYIEKYVVSTFFPVSGNVFIVVNGVGDSAHYRAFNQAEELNLHKIKATVVNQNRLFLKSLAKTGQIFIFARTFSTPKLKDFFQELKRRKKVVFFETDDLVFDAEFIQNTDFFQNKMTRLEKMQYYSGSGEEILRDPFVKNCVTSTEYLKNILEKYNKKIFVSQNKISLQEEKLAETIVKEKIKEKDDSIKIGYFSGTASHNKDFATIVPAIEKILKKYSQAKLCLAGHLDIGSELNQFQNQLIFLPFSSRKKYFQNLFQIDINLAPLVLNDPFCESKSEIKFTEAGILGVPTVAVANQTFSQAIADGENGFLAKSEEEWIKKISLLIENETLRREMGEKARAKVLRDFTNSRSHNENYYAYLLSLMKDKSE